MTFQLCDRVTSPVNCYGPLHQGWTPGGWRPPGAVDPNNPSQEDPSRTDAGYDMTTTDTSHVITIQFGTPGLSNGHVICSGCIDSFSLYWGSLDAYNSITFTDAGGASVTFKGTDIVPSGQLNPNKIASAVAFFQIYKGNTWRSVSFSSTFPAFEFDNIAWHPTTLGYIGSTCSKISPGSDEPPATTPEPSTLLLLLSGGLCVAGGLRHRIRG